MKKLFKKLYESEINLHLSWFWDSGYDVKIGDEMNGYVAEFNTHSIDEVENWVVSNVIKAFPKSKFAKENLIKIFKIRNLLVHQDKESKTSAKNIIDILYLKI
jgi:hypothetical protein